LGFIEESNLEIEINETMKNLRPLSVWEWLVCGIGMFFIGLGIGYINVQIYDYGIGFLIFGLVLEIPAFYLVFKHQREKMI